MTDQTYTDALTDEQCAEIRQRLPLSCALISAGSIRYALAPLLAERHARVVSEDDVSEDEAASVWNRRSTLVDAERLDWLERMIIENRSVQIARSLFSSGFEVGINCSALPSSGSLREVMDKAMAKETWK